MARPLTAEPHLARDMLNAKTEKALPNLVPSRLTVSASSRQLAQIAKQLPIWDYSQNHGVQQFLAYWKAQESSPDEEVNRKVSSRELQANDQQASSRL
jgi:hypothetical protein